MIITDDVTNKYLSCLTSTKVQKFFIVALRVQEDMGLDDLQDLEKVFEILKEHNKINQKERIWGYEFETKTHPDLIKLKEIISKIDIRISSNVEFHNLVEQTQENIKKCFGKNGG